MRAGPAGGEPPKALFLAFRDGALPARVFQRLKRRMHRVGDERRRQTYQTTFWFDLNAPSSVVEQAILRLRPLIPQAKHVRGVEWWLSRMFPTNVRVDFHQDRDEVLARTTGKVVHPVFSSVLFLNRVRGGALAVAPSCSPLEVDFDLAAPRPNRFVCFDGSLTHGVLDSNNQIPLGLKSGPSRLRLAIIMNWWQRRPRRVPTFSSAGVYSALAVEVVSSRRSTR